MQTFSKLMNAVLINVRASSIYSKYYGDSNNLVNALFSLARKISGWGRTVVLFVDEVDGLLGESRGFESDVSVQACTS